jgi:sporulation protein YlmC with PRC-barrel domain
MGDESIALVRLGDAGLTVPPEQDVRGLQVVDREGDDLGRVDDLFVDEGEQRVRFLEIGSGGFLGIGEEKRLIPVDAVERVDEKVHIATTRQQIAQSPGYDPDVKQADYFANLYGYYGFGPYWGAGYVPPGAFR